MEQKIDYEHVLTNMEDKIQILSRAILLHVQGHRSGFKTGGLEPLPSPSKFAITGQKTLQTKLLPLPKRAIYSPPGTRDGSLDDQVQSYLSVLKTLQGRGEGEIVFEEMQRMKALQELVKP